MADPTAEVNLMNTSSINPATVSRGAVTHHAYELYLSCDILTKAESRNICRQPKRRLLQIKNDIRQHIRWVVKNCEKYKNEPHNKKDQQWWHSQWGLQLSTQPVLLHLVSVICPMEKKEKKKVYIWYDCFACLRFKSSTESFLRAEGSMIYTKSHKPFTVHFEQNGHQRYLPFENISSYFIYLCSSLCF